MKRVIGTIVVAAVAFTAGAWAQSTGISLDRANTWAKDNGYMTGERYRENITREQVNAVLMRYHCDKHGQDDPDCPPTTTTTVASRQPEPQPGSVSGQGATPPPEDPPSEDPASGEEETTPPPAETTTTTSAPTTTTAAPATTTTTAPATTTTVAPTPAVIEWAVQTVSAYRRSLSNAPATLAWRVVEAASVDVFINPTGVYERDRYNQPPEQVDHRLSGAFLKAGTTAVGTTRQWIYVDSVQYVEVKFTCQPVDCVVRQVDWWLD